MSVDIEALRLARGKAILEALQDSGLIGTSQRLRSSLARAIEPADAALGVVSVPREATQDMARAYIDAMPIAPGTET